MACKCTETVTRTAQPSTWYQVPPVRTVSTKPPVKHELRIITLITERLQTGLKAYGPLDVHDGRDWLKEALEEDLDACIYRACRLMEIMERLEGES